VRLIKFVLSLPPNATYADGTHRVIIRRALRDILPPQIAERRSKASFGPLLDYGLRARKKFVDALVHDSEVGRRGLAVEPVLQHAIERHLETRQHLPNVYWQCLVMEIWLRIRTGRLPELD
jgi:hypothetical protein